MQQVAGRRLLLGAVVLGSLILGLVSTQAPALSNDGAAWCYDGNRWLGYAEGIPGSATQEEFTECLRLGAESGDIVRFEGQVVEGGALIDVGDSSLFWTLPELHALDVSITAYDDHVAFRDDCGRAFAVREGTSRMIDPGRPCERHERIREDDRTLSDIDFTVFVVQRQFVIDASEGWYHVSRDQTGWSEDPTPRGQITLRAVHGGIWVTTTSVIVGGQYLDTHLPVANTAGDPQQYQAYDWETRVRKELFPRSFNHTAHYLLPDWPAYWAEVRAWLDAINEDLFHGRASPVRLEVLDLIGWEAYANPANRTISTSFGSANVILHELAHVYAGPGEGHGGRFVATLLLLWDRYVPGFDTERALELAQHYSVMVGRPVEVEPQSSLTQVVRDLFAKTAPELPSDYEPINPEDSLLQVTLEVGRSHTYADGAIVANSAISPACVVTKTRSDGSTYLLLHGPHAEFTVNPGGRWNGLALQRYGGGGVDGDHGVSVVGTPTVAGRVRVKISTRCPGGDAQEPRFVGYSEVIVVDPNDQ